MPSDVDPSVTPPSLKKRIIVCCDGTWLDSDGADPKTPSNVTRISRCLQPVGLDRATNLPTPQTIYYQAGVGTGAGLYQKVVGGATGEGLSEHIREAYSFLCNNYANGDEIFILGFSRGAFTARSVASLVRAVGLLTNRGLTYFYPIFEDWENQGKSGWTTSFPEEPWPNRPALHTPEYQRKLLELELTEPDIPIKCVAVWDTVGALGIPMIAILPQPPMAEFSFVNTQVEPNIEYAFQALALDERRRTFSPTIWEKPDGQTLPKVLKQCWFPGVHSDIGGSYTDTDLANLTLAWMISQLDPLLDFDHSYIVRENRLAQERAVRAGRQPRPWGIGKIHDSLSIFYRLLGTVTRTPMQYRETDPRTLRPRKRLLANTNERLHASIRIRMGKKGLGYDDRGTYDPASLQGWKMHGTEVLPNQPMSPGGGTGLTQMKNVVWTKSIANPDPESNGSKDLELSMPEDELGDLERVILNIWPEISSEFGTLVPPGGKDRVDIKRATTFPGVEVRHGEAHKEQLERQLDGVNGHRRPDRVETF